VAGACSFAGQRWVVAAEVQEEDRADADREERHDLVSPVGAAGWEEVDDRGAGVAVEQVAQSSSMAYASASSSSP